MRVFQKYPACAAPGGFVLGAATALLGVWLLGTPWNSERVVERVVEKPVIQVVERPAGKPVATEPDPRRVDLIVMQKNKPLGLDSEFSEELVEQARQIPGVERVSEGVVSIANLQRDNGVDENVFLVQGWRPDNFGFEDMEVTEGRVFKEGDKHKVMLGSMLAANLNKKVGDQFVFVADPDHPYEVIGVFKSRVVFEDGGAIVSFKDGQALTGKKVTGFSVRVKRSSSDFEADVEAVRKKIESLRDPNDPTARLDAAKPERGRR